MALAFHIPLRGEIWLLDFDPAKGREQAGMRPALVISANVFNGGPASLVIVCPIISRHRSIRSHVEVLPPEGGTTTASYIMAEQIRSVTRERLVKRMGTVSSASLEAVADRVRILLNL